ncbi:TPA: hypothetical protein VKD30_001118 [Streptococcus pyogenes]|nr:hypothetical protein [Streptococcus pyogenes]HER3543095.1 hypothetical protein [Streptococcus pyogenes]
MRRLERNNSPDLCLLVFLPIGVPGGLADLLNISVRFLLTTLSQRLSLIDLSFTSKAGIPVIDILISDTL